MSRKKAHTPEGIVGKLRQVEVLTSQGKALAEAVRAIGVTEATYYRWRAEYGGLKLDQVKRLKQLETENAGLFTPARIIQRRVVDGWLQRAGRFCQPSRQRV
jgi:putative transposase